LDFFDHEIPYSWRECGATCQAAFTAGTPLTLTASWNNLDYQFAGWSDACNGSSSTCPFSLNAPSNVTATFNVRPPVAGFTCTPTSGMAPLHVTCTDSSQHLPASWSWTFENGTPTSFAQNAHHTFRNTGTFDVTLTVSNAEGLQADSLTRPAYIRADPCTDGLDPVKLVDAGNNGGELFFDIGRLCRGKQWV